LQSHYDEVHRQLQQAIDQLGACQRKCQALQGELDECRVSLEQAVRARRAAEQQAEDAQTRINELTTINVNLSSAKSKLETEYSALQADYDEVHKELRLTDERVQKLSIELKSTKDALTEEQERFIKIESIKKSLEIEVRPFFCGFFVYSQLMSNHVRLTGAQLHHSLGRSGSECDRRR
jgi:chromosome segregation ATPase